MMASVNTEHVAPLLKAPLSEATLPEAPTPSTESKKSAVKRRYDAAIVSVLEEQYAKKPRVNAEERRWLAQRTGLSEEQIAKWFANRRGRDRDAQSSALVTVESSDSEMSEPPTKVPKPSAEAPGAVQAAAIPSDPIAVTAACTSLISQLALIAPVNQNAEESPEALPSGSSDLNGNILPTPSITNNVEYLLSLVSQLVQQNAAPIAPTSSAKRHTFTEEQRKGLMEAFEQDQTPSGEKHAELAQKFGLRKAQVTRWFQNRRHLLNKEKKAEAESANQ